MNQSIYFLTCGIAVLIAITLMSTPIFSWLDRTEVRRVHRLDGLRGIVALGVMMAHMAYSINFHGFTPGQWFVASEATTNQAAGLDNDPFGSARVAIAFMLSAYIFSQRSYSTTWQWGRFLTTRCFRLLPMAYFAICIFIPVSYWLHPVTETTTFQELTWLTHWLPLPFGIDPPDFAHPRHNFVIYAGVFWTMHWEWLLYLGLPLLLYFRNQIGIMPLAITMITIPCYLVIQYKSMEAGILLSFGIAFFASALNDAKALIPKKALEIIAIFTLILLLFSTSRPVYTLFGTVLIGFFFIAITQGANLFGFLELRGLIRIGEISYSIYLLHGVVWCVEHSVVFVPKCSPSFFIVMTVSTILGIVLLSALTYRWVEMPFIQIGRKVARSVFPEPLDSKKEVASPAVK